MRIAIFSESYEPVVNGVSVSVATLRDALRNRGHDVHIFAPDYPGYEDSEDVHRFPSHFTRFAPPDYPISRLYSHKMRKVFFGINPDVVHTHTPFVLGVAGLRWARLAGIPVVSTNHTLYTEYTHYVPIFPITFSRLFLVWWMQWYYNECDVVAVPSRPVKRSLKSFGIKTPIRIIKSGVSTTRSNCRKEVRQMFGVPDDAFLLLYVGRVAREKNLTLLLRAFKIVQQKHNNARLMIVGSGPYEEECLGQAQELGIDKFIIFTGTVDRNVVSQIYSTADLFTFPSLTETQGLVVCEAIATGLPCVAVKSGGTPEVVKDGVDGILTKNDTVDFAESIIRLIEDPSLRDQLSQGAIMGASRFSVDKMAENFEKVYQSAIEKSKNSVEESTEVTD
jgi:1,2-diacylglycerol 3-alpha-glucosyltransferase